jgi:hypothetical protein
MNNTDKIAHLTLIQGVVNRMGNNSFLVKGWAVTLVAAIFALSAKDSDRHFAFMAFFPIIAFWTLDAYYLRQEKLYRWLYDEVANDVISSDKFSLKTQGGMSKVPNIFRLAMSSSIASFYVLITLLLTILICNSMFFMAKQEVTNFNQENIKQNCEFYLKKVLRSSL